MLTYTLFDTKSLKWSKQPIVPLVVGHIMLKEAGAEFTNAETGNVLNFHYQPGTEWRTVPLFDTRTDKWITLNTCFERKWDEYADGNTEITADKRESEDITGRYQLYVNERLYRVKIRYWLTPYFMWCYNRMPLLSGRGFLDQASGTLLLGADFDARIPLVEAYEKWPRAERLEDVPYAPVGNLLLTIICFYHEVGVKAPSIKGFPDEIELARRRPPTEGA